MKYIIVLLLVAVAGGIGYKLGEHEANTARFDAFADCVIEHINDDGWIAMKCVLDGMVK